MLMPSWWVDEFYSVVGCLMLKVNSFCWPQKSDFKVDKEKESRLDMIGAFHEISFKISSLGPEFRTQANRWTGPAPCA
jgi:hypothetical protein